ncbi:MAG: PAS domain S-box protein, partial [Acidimicrobiia bacterium]
GELSEVARAFDDMAGSLERSFLQTQRVMEVTPEAILMTDAAGRIVMANARTEGLFGYTREELIGQPIELLVPAGQRDAHARVRAGYHDKPVVREMGAKRLDLKGQRKDGSVFPIDVSLGPLITEQGMWVIAAVRDVSERQRFEAEILHQATHDALTGLPNRTLFRELLVHGMAQAARTHGMLAVLFLDLDGFKTVN